ncbi:conditioned medium factor receptor 1-like [Mytilus californianus]|uniref:conditioned medium factor receptor 1-like n=1 Tax=Mytilus californianus TaxID=6549 RepID=UPI0022455B85|nr:conditioned medium factor receptor 1-like [Mytilus californianus]
MTLFETICLMSAIFAAVYIYITKNSNRKSVEDFPIRFSNDKNKNEEKEHYDVAIVGAGPAGSTCAYFLAQKGWKVLLLEKKKFPRDKYCGDVVCRTAIEILIEMGVYQHLIKENKAHVVEGGGLCSPGGLSYIGGRKTKFGEIPAAIACKRILLDESIAMAAKRMGADLKENWPVTETKFDEDTGLWTVYKYGTTDTLTSRVLVCSDGAPSRLATKLGLVTRPPDSTCSRTYVEGGTHKFDADGVVFYNKELLPGYSALFRHPNDILNYCVYVIPGNPKAVPEKIDYWHNWLMKKDPNISRALGDNFKMEKMKTASLRLGGEKRTYDDHVLVVGDAAGMIDPMTGEGIHHAMEGGKIAAIFLDEALNHGNYDAECMKIFHQRWMSQFGDDFKWSMVFSQMMYKFPILLDASTAALQRKGDKFVAKWADIMTGRVPKIHMLKPEFSFTVIYELVRLILQRLKGSNGKQKKAE